MEQNTSTAETKDGRETSPPEGEATAGQQGGTTTEDLVKEQGADSSDEPES